MIENKSHVLVPCSVLDATVEGYSLISIRTNNRLLTVDKLISSKFIVDKDKRVINPSYPREDSGYVVGFIVSGLSKKLEPKHKPCLVELPDSSMFLIPKDFIEELPDNIKLALEVLSEKGKEDPR